MCARRLEVLALFAPARLLAAAAASSAELRPTSLLLQLGLLLGLRVGAGGQGGLPRTLLALSQSPELKALRPSACLGIRRKGGPVSRHPPGIRERCRKVAPRQHRHLWIARQVTVNKMLFLEQYLDRQHQQHDLRRCHCPTL